MLRCLVFLCLTALTTTSAQTQVMEMPISHAARADWAFIGQVGHGHDRLGLCTGTLIAPDLVLTAAHCVVHPESGKIAPFHRVRFRAGLHEAEESASSFARAIAVHPRYLELVTEPGIKPLDLFEYDVALVTLKHPITNVAPAPISAPQNLSGEASVLGYQKNSADILVDYIGCAVTLTDARFIGLSCAVKSGTSGGPVLKRVREQWELIGVVVAATGEKQSDVKGVAVRIDTEKLPDIFPAIFP